MTLARLYGSDGWQTSPGVPVLYGPIVIRAADFDGDGSEVELFTPDDGDVLVTPIFYSSRPSDFVPWSSDINAALFIGQYDDENDPWYQSNVGLVDFDHLSNSAGFTFYAFAEGNLYLDGVGKYVGGVVMSGSPVKAKLELHGDTLDPAGVLVVYAMVATPQAVA